MYRLVRFSVAWQDWSGDNLHMGGNFASLFVSVYTVKNGKGKGRTSVNRYLLCTVGYPSRTGEVKLLYMHRTPSIPSRK